MASSWTSYLPQAEKWVSGLGLHPLYGHPHKKKKARHHKLAKAHLKNHLLSHAKHPKAAPAITARNNPFRRTKRGAYETK